MGLRGPPKGCKKTNGRRKGGLNKTTLAKRALLQDIKDIFEAKDYSPIDCAVDIAQKLRLGKNDATYFGFHMSLARKYYGDVSSVHVDASATSPELHALLELFAGLTPKKMRKAFEAAAESLNPSTNGHAIVVPVEEET